MSYRRKREYTIADLEARYEFFKGQRKAQPQAVPAKQPYVHPRDQPVRIYAEVRQGEARAYYRAGPEKKKQMRAAMFSRKLGEFGCN